MIEFGNMQSQYDNLKSEEQVLDKLFDQTKYGKKKKTSRRVSGETCG